MGCTFDASGGGTSATAGVASDSGSTGTTVGVETGTTFAGQDETTSASPGGESSSSGSTTVPEPTGDGSSGTTGEPVPALSCLEILEADPSAPTGTYSIARARDGTKVEVHCEMELDGGGWTLVARSAVGMEELFGWAVATGALGNEAVAYSLDAVDVGLPFMEILLAQREGFATPVENAYVVEVPDGFLAGYGATAYEHAGARTVLGSCDPDGGPAMLSWVGYTNDQRRLFFRDAPEALPYGLQSNGLRTAYPNCQQGGDLDGQQGAVFVR